MKQLEIGDRFEVYRVNDPHRYIPDEVKPGCYRIGELMPTLPLVEIVHAEYKGQPWAMGTQDSIFENEVTPVGRLVIKQLKNIG